MNRRECIAGLGSAAVWPLAGWAQSVLPVIGFLGGGSPAAWTPLLTTFRHGLM